MGVNVAVGDGGTRTLDKKRVRRSSDDHVRWGERKKVILTLLGLVSLEGDLFTQIDCLLCTDKSVSLLGGLEQCVETVTLEAFRRRDVGISGAQRR